MRKIILSLLCLVSIIKLQAQTTISIGSGTNSSNTSESSPINIYYTSHHCQILYTQAELNSAGWIGAGVITKLGFNIFGSTSEGLPNFSIKLKNTSSSNLGIYDGSGLNTVFTSTLYSPTAGGFELLTLSNSFVWDGSSNLLVDVCFDPVSAWSSTGQVYTYTYTSTGSQYQSVRVDGVSQCGVATNTDNFITKPQLQLELNALNPCTGSPISGNAASSNTFICTNTGFNLNLINGSVASGLEFQWQSSIDSITWTNLGSIQNNGFYAINSITATTYYQCITTCTSSAQSATSTPIVVNLNPLINCYCMPGYSWDCSGDKFLDFSLANITAQTNTCSVGGYSDSTSSAITVINLTAGNTYTLITTATSSGIIGNAAIGAWIDYNQNGIFDSSEFTYLGYGNGGSFSSPLTVPFTSPSGSVRMRLKLDANYATAGTMLDPCINNNFSSYGQILDYKVNITAATPCAGTPSAGIAISSSTAVCQNVSYTLDLVNNSIVSGITYQWQSSLDGGATWTDLGLAQNTVPYSVSSQNVSTQYRCITTCTNSALSDTSSPVTVSQNLPTTCYCNLPTINCTTSSITNVIFETINDNPICNASGYINNSGIISPVALTASQNYTISTNLNCQSSTGYIGVWIDYNQDGIFDSYEYNDIGNISSGTLTGNIYVPFTALAGNTKMRLKMESTFGTFQGLYPCTNIESEGETIDYDVVITPEVPCSGTPNAGNADAPSTTICENISFDLNLLNNDVVSNISYQWQSSPDNVIWTNIGASQTTVPFYISTQTVTTHYRCVTTCTTSALSATSTPIAILQNPVTDCYCVPPVAICSSNDEINNVVFANLSNTSACSTDGYEDYSASVASATINAGQTYAIDVTVGSDYFGKVSAWIDYNQNGIFDATEYTFLGITNSAGDSIVNGSINIPISALLGNTKMRIRNNNQFSFLADDACADGAMGAKSITTAPGNGETEDYLITILPPDCSSIIFPSTISIIGTTDICPGASTTLDFSSTLPTATGITYQWKSFNGTTFVNDGPVSSTSNFTATPTANTTYFCEILCNGTPVMNSDTVFITVHYITTAPLVTNTSCFGTCNGSIILNASSTSSTISYTWTPSFVGTTDTITGLCASVYTVDLSNTYGCSITETVTVIEPASIIATSTQSNVSCFGLNNGSAAMMVSGGTSPLSFNWSPTGGNSLIASNLIAGNYTFNIIDDNGCTLNDTVIITQPGAMLVSISGTNSICEQLPDTITSSISGGAGPFIYSWTELPGNVVSSDPNYTYTSAIGTYSYNLNVTDATNCTMNSNTLSITVNPSSNISGTVTTNPSLPVSGRVILFKYLPFFTKFDSVAGQNIGAAGDYNFTSFTSGTYIVKAIPNANNLQISYGDSAVNWKTAKEILHGCAVNDIQNINVIALSTFTTTGTGSLSGKITEGDKFGQRMGSGFKPTAPGNPIGGIIVKGGKNPGGQMFVQTTTDPTTGTYTLSGLPINTGNESYFILVDIPGLDTNQTYHEIITLTNNAFINLDFVVDSAKINPIHISDVSVNNISAIEHHIKVFPNPSNNKVTIQYNLLENSNVKIELYDILGKSIKTILPTTEQSIKDYSYTVQLNEITAGMYFMKLKINNSESVIKLVISN